MIQTSDISEPISAVILAAGRGTRMASDRPKVLHGVGGRALLHHAMDAAATLAPARTVVVVGHGGDAVADAARSALGDVAIVHQHDQRGTGHAVLCAGEALAGVAGDLIVLYGDVPFLSRETLHAVRAARARADIVVLGFEAADPGRYGRLITGADGALEAIVEAGDATPDQLEIDFCNSGVMAGPVATILDLLGRVTPDNAQGELYLTDIVSLAHAAGLRVTTEACAEAETLGINDRAQLAAAEAVFQDRARAAAMAAGATLIAPETVFFSADTRLGRDVVVEPNVIFGPGVAVGDGCVIRAFCHLVDTVLAAHVQVGPFARMRGGTTLADGVRIGNFVELKAATLGPGTKAGHLAYLGDASLGAGVNVGAGAITCNYDGVRKHRTTVGDNAFIGVQTAMVAPISIGADAYVGTGTVLTEDVPDDTFALARAPQVNRAGLASRLRARFSARSRTPRTGG